MDFSNLWNHCYRFQWRSQPKSLAGPKCLILREKRYFVGKKASQSTKSPYFSKNLGGMALLAPPMATPMTDLLTLLFTQYKTRRGLPLSTMSLSRCITCPDVCVL